MKAKAILVTVLTAAAVIVLAPGIGTAGYLEGQQVRQRATIYEGMNSGRITEAEFEALDEEQYSIETQRREAFSDGYLDRGEKRRLTRSLDRAGEHIRMARSNGSRNRRGHWRWESRYDRYRRHDYWRDHYRYGPYRGSCCWDRPPQPRPRPHYRPRPRPRPLPRYDHPRNPRPYGGGYLHFEIHQPGFGLGWSIGL